MGAAAFYDAPVFLLQSAEGGNEAVNCGKQLVLQADDGGNVHGSGKGVVGGLAHVDVVIGMQEPLSVCAAAVGEISRKGNHLVGVHVGLSAAAGLPHHQGKMLPQLARNYPVAGRLDCRKLLRRHLFWQKLVVCLGGCFFQQAEGPDDFFRHGLYSRSDSKIVAAALRLGSPEPVRRNLHLAHGVMLNPVFHLLTSVLRVFISILKGATRGKGKSCKMGVGKFIEKTPIF